MPSPGILAPTPPRKATVIHARTEYEDISNFQPTDIAIAGGVREITTALIDAIEALATSQRLAKLREPRMAAAEEDFARRLADQRKAAEEDWDAAPMSWARMARELDQHLAEDAIVVSELDNRLPYHWMDFAAVSRAFGVDAETVVEPGGMAGALERARRANRDGGAYLIDARIIQQGHGANSTWHPGISIAGNRKRQI